MKAPTAILCLALVSCATPQASKVSYHRDAKEVFTVEIPAAQPNVFTLFLGADCGCAQSLLPPMNSTKEAFLFIFLMIGTMTFAVLIGSIMPNEGGVPVREDEEYTEPFHGCGPEEPSTSEDCLSPRQRAYLKRYRKSQSVSHKTTP